MSKFELQHSVRLYQPATPAPISGQLGKRRKNDLTRDARNVMRDQNQIMFRVSRITQYLKDQEYDSVLRKWRLQPLQTIHRHAVNT